jgi:putative transposase
MMYPLVRDLAADTVPVAVTCRVLGFSKQAFYKWLAEPVCRRDWDDAHLINAALDIHHDDPEFGYRFIADELATLGIRASRNRVNRLCTLQRIFSVHSKKRGTGRTPGPPVHDDLVERQFTAERPNLLWLTDITEHPTGEGKLYCCVVLDLYSRKVVGWAIDRRCETVLVNDALAKAGARSAVGTRHRHPLRPRQPAQFTSWAFTENVRRLASPARWAPPATATTTPPWSRSGARCRSSS